MLRRIFTGFFRRTHPYVLASLFLSVAGPSIFLVYTGIYGIWSHIIVMLLLAACFIALLIYHFEHSAGTSVKPASHSPARENNSPPASFFIIDRLDYEFQSFEQARPLILAEERSSGAHKQASLR